MFYDLCKSYMDGKILKFKNYWNIGNIKRVESTVGIKRLC